MENRKEIIYYLIFGFLTTAVNIFCFWLLNSIVSMDYRVATSIAWVVSVIFAFITNKLYVFNSKETGTSSIIKELMSFLFFRLLSYVFDLSFMIIFVDFLKVNSLFAKIIANVFVVIFNYFASKFVIFKPLKSSR